MNTKRICLLTILFIFLPTLSLAEIVTYKDDQGRTHFVDSSDKVPAEYKDQLKDAKPLPTISRPGKAKYYKTKKGDYSVSRRRKAKVEVYVTSWCGYCKKLEKFLSANKISYSRYDVEKDPAAMKRYKELGGNGYPFTRIGDKSISGYSEGQIKSALNIR